MNSKAKGERTEGIVLARLLQLGHVVLMPFGDNQRYDLVIDEGDGKFIRGQCKTARISNGCVAFNTASVNGFTGKRKTYKGQIDVFWVYSPDTDDVYEVPINSVGINESRLRIKPPKGGAISGIRWAKDFKI